MVVPPVRFMPSQEPRTGRDEYDTYEDLDVEKSSDLS